MKEEAIHTTRKRRKKVHSCFVLLTGSLSQHTSSDRIATKRTGEGSSVHVLLALRACPGFLHVVKVTTNSAFAVKFSRKERKNVMLKLSFKTKSVCLLGNDFSFPFPSFNPRHIEGYNFFPLNREGGLH